MSEPIPEIQETGSDSNISEIIKIIAGLIFFLVSFGLLWRNEGRVDIPTLIRDCIPAAVETVDHAATGKLVSVTCEIKSEELLGDPGFLDFGPYIALNRKVEMYAWVEHEPIDAEGKNKRKAGFSYQREWADTPHNSDTFIEPSGHRNPTLPLQSRSYVVEEATIGAYRFSPRSASLPTASPVSITKKNYVRSLETDLRGEYLFIGKGRIKEPKVGDVRVSYSAVNSGIRATLFGKLAGDTVEPYFYKNNMRIYRLLPGSREDALSQIPTASKATAWILRLAGLLIMWGGLSLCFKPLNTRFKFVPALDRAEQSKAGGIMLVAAFALTLLTLLISSLTRNVFVLGLALAAAGIAIRLLAGERSLSQLAASRSRPSTPAQPTRQPPPPPPQASRVKRSTLPLHDEQLRQTDPNDPKDSVRPPDAKTKNMPGQIKIACEGCGLGYTVPAAYKGRKVRCHKCDHKFYIPLGSDDEGSSPTVMDTSS